MKSLGEIFFWFKEAGWEVYLPGPVHTNNYNGTFSRLALKLYGDSDKPFQLLAMDLDRKNSEIHRANPNIQLTHKELLLRVRRECRGNSPVICSKTASMEHYEHKRKAPDEQNPIPPSGAVILKFDRKS